MARVPYPQKHELPEPERHIYERMERERGVPTAMEIVLTVAWYNAVVRILLPLRIEKEGWFKRM
jgi:hypothetical protein